jgi:S1-C subfamily serine protease
VVASHFGQPEASFMLGWKCCGRLIVVLALLALASCRQTTDTGLDPTPPLSASVQVSSSWHQGLGFLVDRDERLLITGAQVIGSGDEDLDVVFPVVEDGKVKSRRDFYQKQPRIKARIINFDKPHDLAVLQLVEPVPEGIAELKLAATNPADNAPVQTVVDAGLKSTLWAPKSTSVVGTFAGEFNLPDTRVSSRMVELALESKFGKGSVGAPVINEAGELVAVVTNGSPKAHVVAIEAAEATQAARRCLSQPGQHRLPGRCTKARGRQEGGS